MPDGIPADLLIAAAEEALAAGDPERARQQLDLAAVAGIDDATLSRFVMALTMANRLLSRHRETLAWIETRLAAPHGAAARAVLLRGRIAALRQLDTRAVLDHVEEALAAARAVADHDALANVLSNASFCAYRQGNGRLAARYAELAAERSFPSPLAQLDALRTRMFAATANGELERSLALSREIRDAHLERGDVAGAANEGNNIAEGLLSLGLPADARVEADDAEDLGTQSGHRAVTGYARMLRARATGELGDVDGAIAQLRSGEVDVNNVMLALDAWAILAYWLVERDAAGDAAQAAQVAASAVKGATAAGVNHCLTTLLATQARAQLRLGDADGARALLGEARVAADAADTMAEQQLALTMAEVLPAGDPAREVALRGARTRILLAAARRDDALGFCTRVRLHRRLLELSGGVPTDLPRPL